MPPAHLSVPHPLLQSPVWAALTTRQATLSLKAGRLIHFPADIAPFCAVEHDGAHLTAAEIQALPGDMYFLGAMPAPAAELALTALRPVLQLVHNGRPAATAANGAGITVLDDGDNAAMLALITLVYPGYFRSNTASLGKYVGIHQDGQLVAMAGQRMHITGYREISAVCTRPGYTGRGYAGQLMAWLVRAILADGERPFLHVNSGNARAQTLYEQMGFDVTRELRHARVSIAPSAASQPPLTTNRNQHA